MDNSNSEHPPIRRVRVMPIPNIAVRDHTRWHSPAREWYAETFNKTFPHAYWMAYGWAVGAYGSNSKPTNEVIMDMALFYNSAALDKAWETYVGDFLLDVPFFGETPPWDDVYHRLQWILADPSRIAPYLGAQLDSQVDRSRWSQIQHICLFIFRLLHTRDQFEAKPNDVALATKLGLNEDYATAQGKPGSTLTVWQTVDRWTAARLLYEILIWLQDTYAIESMYDKPNKYVDFFREAEARGGVNPLVVPQDGRTIEAYQVALVNSTRSFRSR